MTPSENNENANPEVEELLPPRTGWLRRQFSDIVHVVKRDKKWWLLPLLLALLLLAVLLLSATALGPLAPFIYPFL